MKFLKPRIIVPIIAIFLVAATCAVIASPGGSDDPLITLSFINDKLIPEIKAYIDSKTPGGSSDGQNSASTFKLVNVKAGNKIIGHEGTEFVLRMGSGTIIATGNGGVADLTAGVDLTNGSPIPPNHNLLSPINDSRGLYMHTDGIILIKGTYTIY